MKWLLLFIIATLFVGWQTNNFIDKVFEEPTKITISEDECYENGGSWEFIEAWDKYGTDLSGFTCVLDN